MSILKTYINYIGEIGNFEKDSDADGVADGWTKGTAGAYSISDKNFSVGLRSQRIASLPDDPDAQSRFVQCQNIPYEAGKFYFIGVDVFTDGMAHASLRVNFGGEWQEAKEVTGKKSSFLFLIVNPTSSGEDGIVELRNITPIPLTSWIDFDGVRMYEISEKEAELANDSHAVSLSLRYRYAVSSFTGPNLAAFNTNNPILGEKLYDNLPRIYKVLDAEQKPIPYPLKRFFQIAGVGLEFLKEKIDGHMRMYDPLTCPPELLPYLFRLSGFEPPNFLSEDRRRAFLKILPTLYRTKGSKRVFEYLGRTIFGQDSEFIAASREGNNIIIDLSLVLDGAMPDLNIKTEQFRYLAEYFRPVNRQLNIIAILRYFDEYRVHITEEEAQTILNVLEQDENYVLDVETADAYYRELIKFFESDFYTLPTQEEDFAVITMSPTGDTYDAVKTDSYTDVLIQTNVIGRGVLGLMRLGRKNTIINTISG